MALTKVRGKGLGTLGDGTASDNSIIFDGNAQDFHIGLDDSADSLTIGLGSTLGTTSHMIIDANGHITKPLQSAFHVKPSADQTNIANADTIVFDEERFDQNGDFSSNTFTAPVTGKYNLSFSVRIDNVDSDATFTRVILRVSNRDLTSQINDLRGLSGDPVYWNFALSVLIDMDANDTAHLEFTQYVGTTQADIKQASHFSGYLVC